MIVYSLVVTLCAERKTKKLAINVNNNNDKLVIVLKRLNWATCDNLKKLS